MYVPAYDEPADAKDYRLMKDAEGQHRLVAVGQYLVVEIQAIGCQAKNEHYPAKVTDANHDVKEHICPRKGLDTRIGVMKSNNENTFTPIGSNTHGQEYPPISLVTFCKASVRSHDIAYPEKSNRKDTIFKDGVGSPSISGMDARFSVHQIKQECSSTYSSKD